MKKWKAVLLIVAGICTLVLVAMLLLHAWLPGFLSDKIEGEIRSALNPESVDLYEVEAGTSSFSTFFKTTSITEIRLIPKDSALLQTDAGLLPGKIFEAVARDLKISSWALVSMAMDWKSVKVNLFAVDSIFFAIYTNESGITKADSGQSMNLEHLHLKNLSTNKLRVEKRSLADPSIQVLHTGKVDFRGVISFYGKVKEYFMDTGFEAHSLLVLDAGSYSSQGLHTFHVDSVFYAEIEQTADLKGLRVIPRYSKQEFHKHVQYETDRFDTRLDHVKISGIQLDKATQEGSIILSQIEMNGGKLEVFRDRKPPFNENQRPPLPARLIQEAPFGIFAGKVVINNIDIVYMEQLVNSDTPGEIPFKQVNATIENISNFKDSLVLDNIMNIRAEALIFDNAMLQVEFKYDLTNPYGAYEAKGEMAQLRFVNVNPALYPLTGLKVIDGSHQATSFYFYGNDVRSVGGLRMKYSELEIELLPDGRRVFKGLARFVGRNFLYYQANPPIKDELRVGQIEFDRDNTRFVFNYWWKSYLSGIKNSVLKDHFN
jgi:hypothetical protein